MSLKKERVYTIFAAVVITSIVFSGFTFYVFGNRAFSYTHIVTQPLTSSLPAVSASLYKKKKDFPTFTGLTFDPQQKQALITNPEQHLQTSL